MWGSDWCNIVMWCSDWCNIVMWCSDWCNIVLWHFDWCNSLSVASLNRDYSITRAVVLMRTQLLSFFNRCMFVCLDEDLRSTRDKKVKEQWQSSNAKKLPRIPKRNPKAQYRERDDTSPLNEGPKPTEAMLVIPDEVRVAWRRTFL